METSGDLQGTVIGVGTLVAIGVLIYGTFVDTTLFGVETLTVAGWVFAITLGAVAILHASVGQYDLTWGFGGVAIGWLIVLLGTDEQIILGVFVLVLSGLYVVLVTRRRNRELATETVDDDTG